MKLFDANKPFFKGNTHMHTTRSDGHKTPEDACAEYAAHGYDFVVLTDHRTVGPTGRHENMLVMSGVEYDYTFPDQVLHVVAVLPDDSMERDGWFPDDYNATIRSINAHGGAAILAHPTWSLNTTAFMLGVEGVCASEIFNTYSGYPWNAPRADGGIPLDLLSTAGRLLPLVAADDTHQYIGEQCVSYTMVQAEECTPQAIIDALKSGRFYASQGPRFENVELLDDRLIVTTTPVECVTFLSNIPWVKGRCRVGRGITREEYMFERQRGEQWVRVEVTDTEGKRAWLSPIKV